MVEPSRMQIVYNTSMSKKLPLPAQAKRPRWYRGADVPMSVIRRYAREVAQKFEPEKIILFGSHAYGKPHADSDVDILVVMPCRHEIAQAIRIDRVVDPAFPLDLVVFKPKNVAWRLEEGDTFLGEVMSKGKVLYEKADRSVGAKGRVRLHSGQKTGAGKRSTA